MADNLNDQKYPHGVTGDTVQQAAEVSRPTATVDRVVNVDGEAKLVPDPRTGSDARGNAATGRDVQQVNLTESRKATK
ncbi:hypothetical protein [Massilia sp. 9096]|uniref:hypothetical protein n=1 Tax=Massilia sp. 9096 TaxID=1500894 RepID=UPI000AD01932|nr:hypothetical protein [Massilia sp. 9096]